jgi:Xaa-Pro aminopeptidase
MNKKTLNKRRENLLNQMKDNEMIVIFANSQPSYPRYFLQENNFLYFTGLNIPEAVFVQKRINGRAQSAVFIERGIPEMEVWEGNKMTKEEASNISDIKAVSFLDEFNRKMQYYLSEVEKCYVNSLGGNLANTLNKQKLFIQKAKEHFPQISANDAMKLVSNLRAVKDKDEIKQLQKAIDITGLGIGSIRKQAKAGMMEYELEAILKYEANRNNPKHMSFHPIIASGVNAATLHYHQNYSKIGKNDLVLLDVGAAYNSYCADITRTFPVSGKFTKR